MAALGERFRAAREARGLSESDVAGAIHIRSVYLAAIEAEDWNAIGAPVYVRGFLRTYARFLGLDAEAAVQAFNETTAAAAPAAPASGSLAATSAGRSAVAASEPGRRPIWGPIAAIVALVLVAFVGYQYWQYQVAQGGGDGSSVALRSAAPVPVSAQPTVSAVAAAPESAAPTVAPSAAPAATPAAAHQLAVTLSDASWLRVVVDGSVALEGTFPAGTSRTFKGRAATLRIGNAGGVHVAVNGRDVGALGASGDVVERSFNLGG